MKTLVVAEYGVRLRASGETILVETREKKLKVPVGEVDQIIVATGAVSITSSLVRLLARHGVEIVFTTGRGEPLALLYAPHYTRTPTTRREQYLAMLDGRGNAIAAAMAWSKTWNQAKHLEWRAVENHRPELREEASRIRERCEKLRLLRDPEPRSVLRLEAEAARIYWSGIASLLPETLGFNGRDPDAGDPLNTALNYSYAILYSAAWRNLLMAGLDPYAGFLHADRSGKPVLVYDYSDMFKPGLIDYALIDLARSGWSPEVKHGVLTPKSRARLAEAVLRRMKHRTRTLADPHSVSYEDALRIYAYRLAKALRDRTAYQGFAER